MPYDLSLYSAMRERTNEGQVLVVGEESVPCWMSPADAVDAAAARDACTRHHLQQSLRRTLITSNGLYPVGGRVAVMLVGLVRSGMESWRDTMVANLAVMSGAHPELDVYVNIAFDDAMLAHFGLENSTQSEQEQWVRNLFSSHGYGDNLVHVRVADTPLVVNQWGQRVRGKFCTPQPGSDGARFMAYGGATQFLRMYEEWPFLLSYESWRGEAYRAVVRLQAESVVKSFPSHGDWDHFPRSGRSMCGMNWSRGTNKEYYAHDHVWVASRDVAEELFVYIPLVSLGFYRRELLFDMQQWGYLHSARSPPVTALGDTTCIADSPEGAVYQVFSFQDFGDTSIFECGDANFRGYIDSRHGRISW